MYQEIFKLHADTLKSLSHPKRLEIIHLLCDQSLPVTDMQQMLGLPQANLSQHLQVLRNHNIVASEKKGKQIFYQVSHPNYLQACNLIREVLKQEHNLSELLPTAIDPICGMRLTPSTTAFVDMHDGITNYFCASGCLKKYKQQHKLSN